ncbi:hypothetical protein G7K_0422-t1 [Saitoella complicata NRRL Y-17804]|uniref:HECT-type E3 ubiquitin transferase n=2 Tax=Saitoella complicata (strain BCRC 22490 / CBS 7301 / JCM 7358 / NBRC 10748 / NRRL Y-17804) TaxID=698492 RepID=A0A0E9N9V2_SAICN|nr:hypothetical protein G7K_0422-t1 [Saitoella complicata NRRL Y-17804]
MTKIKKTAPRRLATPPAFLNDYIQKASSCPEPELAEHLATLQEWTFPRGDVYNWIPVLDRFDEILERIVTEWGLKKGIQTKEFDGDTEKLVREMLRVSTMLMDWCSNRTLYSSGAQLNDLLHTTSPEILLATLNLSLRLAQRASTRSSRPALPISADRLLEIALMHPTSRTGHRLDFLKLTSPEPVGKEYQSLTWSWHRHLEGDEAREVAEREQAEREKHEGVTPALARRPSAREVHSHLPPTTPTPASRTAPRPQPPVPQSEKKEKESPEKEKEAENGLQEGMTTIELGPDVLTSKPVVDVVQDIISQNKLSEKSHFALLLKTRLVASINDVPTRLTLFQCRVLAIACFTYVAQENVFTSRFLVTEPEIVQQLAELVHPDRKVDRVVQTSVFYALEAIAHHRPKLGDVLSSLNASVNHGVLLYIIRRAIHDLEERAADKEVRAYMDALFGLLHYLSSTQQAGLMLCSAGILPLLVQFMKLEPAATTRAVTKGVGLLDHLVYGFQPAFTSFCGCNGLNILVDRIQSEVNTAVEKAPQWEGQKSGTMDYAMSVENFALLKCMLKFVLHMMQTSGNQDGLRNLIDSSLLKSLSVIFGNEAVFGSSVFAVAVNILATFIHNEPTSYPIIHEAKLSHAFLEAVSNNILPSADVMASLPNAFGAICLNSQGAELFKQYSPLTKFFEVFLMTEHVKLLTHTDVSGILGTSVDELVRHHPVLKEEVMTGVVTVLKGMIEMGQESGNPAISGTIEAKLHARSAAAEVASTSGDVEMTDTRDDKAATTVDKKKDEEEDRPMIEMFIDFWARFLEGLFQNQGHCKRFIELDGPNTLLALYTLPALPYNFAQSPGAYSLSHILRLLSEVNATTVLAAILQGLYVYVNKANELMPATNESIFEHFLDVQQTDEEVVSAGTYALRTLVRAHNMTTLLAEIYATPIFSHGRSTLPFFLPFATDEQNKDLIASLGQLQRMCIWEEILLTAPLSKEWNEASRVKDDDTPKSKENEEKQKGLEAGVDKDDPKFKNVKTFRFLVSQIPASITPFFQGLSKMLFTRRQPDANHRKQALKVSGRMARVMIENLSWERAAESDNANNKYGFCIVMLHFLMQVLMDDRSTPVLQITVLYSFYKQDGMKVLSRILDSLMQEAATLPFVTDQEIEKDGHSKMAYVFGGIKIVLKFFHQITTPKILVDAAQSTGMASKERDRNTPDFYQANEFLVQLRREVLPAAHKIWESPTLLKLSSSIVKSVAQIMAASLKGDAEVAATRPEVSTRDPFSLIGRGIAALTAPNASETDRVGVLTGMGFSRGAARHALQHAANNITIATQYLLSHPELQQMPEQTPAQAEPAPQAAPATDAAGTGAAVPATTGEGDTSMQVDEDKPSQASILEQLNELRNDIRTSLIDRALEVIRVHNDATYDVAQLVINAPVDWKQDGWKKDAVLTVILSLDSLSESRFDSEDNAKGLTTIAHLLNYLLHDGHLYEKCNSLLPQLTPVLMELAKVEDGKPAPWLPHIFLIMETVITDVDEATKVSSTEDGSLQDTSSSGTHTLSVEARKSFFDSALAVLTSEPTEKNLTLAVLRVLLRLTRNREYASMFVDRGGLALLFANLRKTVGKYDDSIQIPIISILRHVIEDRETLKAIMRSEIQTFFDQPRAGGRAVDASTYLRGLSQLALRDSALFIEATQEMCKISRYDPNARTQGIVLKDKPKDDEATSTMSAEEKPILNATKALAVEETPKRSSFERQDGVIHFLLTELLSCKDERRDSGVPAQSSDGNKDVNMQNTVESEYVEDGKRPDFKAEDHPGYIYRCFILQSLSELLSCYTRCKLEFVKFSRRANPREAMTPAVKPRSTVLNHLLYELIPHGFVNVPEDNQSRMRYSTSNWAMSVVVALCAATGEDLGRDNEADLQFVRKFVLEGILKTFKDITASTEPMEYRYSRLMTLADLCYRLLVAQANQGTTNQGLFNDTHDKLAKLMFEKNFVSTLTNALAEVDLNYPLARKVIRQVLRPLKTLSKTAIRLSESAELGDLQEKPTGDEDEISTEASLSDEDDESSDREETPDLYRNSALGMFDGNMEEDNSEGDSENEFDDEDAEMYEEMEFDHDGSETGSDLSDEDMEDLQGGDDVEIVLDEDEDEDHDDEDEDDDELGSDEEMEMEILGEIDGSDIELDGGDDDEEDEDDDEDDSMDDESIDDQDDDEAEEDAAWETEEAAEGDVQNPFNIDPEGDDDDDDDLDDMDSIDEAIMAADDLADEEAEETHMGWETTADEPGQAQAPRPPRGTMFPFGLPGMRPSAMGSLGGIPDIRRPRHGEDAGASHPLLVNPAAAVATAPHEPARRGGDTSRPDSFSDWIHSIEELIGSGAVHMLGDAINRLSNAPPGAIRVEVATSNGNVLTHDLEQILGRRPGANVSRPPREDPTSATTGFVPTATFVRWNDEVRIIYGSTSNVAERLQRLVSRLADALIPAAVEEERVRKEEERKAQEKARAEDEARRKEEAARLAKEREEAEARAREEAERKAAEEAARVAESAGQDTPMEGMEGSGEAGPSASRQRATVRLRGAEVDITELDVDAEFLEALPEDMREEVLSQHIRERRASTRPDEPSEISPEFLEALPDDIREELLAQEAADRRRREREREREEQQAPDAQASTGPAEIDPASFLASLDPELRRSVLADAEDDFIAQLPPALAAEAGNMRPRGTLNVGRPGGAIEQLLQGRRGTAAEGGEAGKKEELKKPAPRRDMIQLLDKSGIATLVRLLFLPQVGEKTILHDILLNVCENKQNRAEIVNLLLAVLQDGSGSLHAVEKSFAQVSYRAKGPNTPKPTTKPKLGSALGSLTQVAGDNAPMVLAQQCLQTLSHIVGWNEHLAMFFLHEHELFGGLRKPNKKGKNKEPPRSAKFPINMLLSLLERPLFLQNTGIMDSLSQLLSATTRPLIALSKKEAKLKEEAKKDADASKESAQATESSAVSEVESKVTEAPTSDAKPATETKKKSLQPPVIPETNMRLVVNILTARECSSRTFQSTLATMHHLAALPEGRDVIAGELVKQARHLGDVIHADLDALVVKIKAAKNGEDVQGLALAQFSPASSDQAKLLRILKAMDYLFDRNRASVNLSKQEKIDILGDLYERLAFTQLWDKLSACLDAVHEHADMMHVATVLLPLIEALMVVCKNTDSSKDAAAVTQDLSQDAPTNASQALLLSFTDKHRKILNQMVRNNPNLMSGSFSLLVRNPKALEFDNKRNYFTRKIHERPNTRDTFAPLQLNVRRDQVFHDSFRALYFKTADEIKYSKLNIRFHGEEGVDAGGVTREWFQVLARQMFNPDYALFTPVSSDSTTFHPNQTSGVNPEHLLFFKFIGRIIGKALYDNRLLDCYFSRAVYKRMLGTPVSLKDMESLDLDYYKSLCWILENDITDIIAETFSMEVDEYGVTKIIDLKPDGRNIPVTEENKQEYVKLVVEYRLITSVKEQLDNFIMGFHDIISPDLVKIFNEKELELLISGLPDIDIDDWRNNTEYQNYTAASPQVQWFWRAVRSFDDEERAKLLQFSTGTSKVPLNGFKELEGMQGIQKFSIHRDFASIERLPQSHTCFNQLDLPAYESYEQLRTQLLMAISEGNVGFGFA